MMAHPNYDQFWKVRNILPKLRNIKCATMTVGGWYDNEDLYGALETYRWIEKQNPGIYNVLVMGPWFHGGWSRSDGDWLGTAYFGGKTGVHYRAVHLHPYYVEALGFRLMQARGVFMTREQVAEVLRLDLREVGVDDEGRATRGSGQSCLHRGTLSAARVLDPARIEMIEVGGPVGHPGALRRHRVTPRSRSRTRGSWPRPSAPCLQAPRTPGRR
jgi:hypothetical protein